MECAEAWGFEPGTINETTWLGYCTPLHAETLYQLECDSDESDEKPDHILAKVPYFVGDANAALSLAAALADEGWTWVAMNIGKDVKFVFFRSKLGVANGDMHEATAPTFALALCLAFLKTHRSKKEDP